MEETIHHFQATQHDIIVHQHEALLDIPNAYDNTTTSGGGGIASKSAVQSRNGSVTTTTGGGVPSTGKPGLAPLILPDETMVPPAPPISARDTPVSSRANSSHNVFFNNNNNNNNGPSKSESKREVLTVIINIIKNAVTKVCILFILPFSWLYLTSIILFYYLL